jgi:hypothetical protein
VIGLLAALLISSIGGLGVFALVRPRRATDVFEAAGISVLFGSALTSVLLFAVAELCTGAALLAVVSVFLLIGGGAAMLPFLRQAEWHAPRGRGLFVGLLFAGAAFVAWQAWAQPLGGDGLFNFESRARLAWERGGRVPHEFFSDDTRGWFHPGNPLFLSMNQLWVYLWLGEPNQVLVKTLGAVWWAATASVIFSQLARLTGEAHRGLIAPGLMLFVPAIVTARGGAVWLWGDFPLAAMSAIAALYLIENLARGTSLGCFAFAVATLPWIKREGVLLGAILLAVFAWTAMRRRRWADIAIAVAPFVAVAVAWKVITMALRAPPLGDIATPSVELLIANFDRVPRVIVLAARELTVVFRWSLLWPLALLAAWRMVREPSLSMWRPIAVIIALAVTIYAALYVFGTWPQLAWQMTNSYPRLLLAPAMIAIVLVAAAVPLSPRSREDR